MAIKWNSPFHVIPHATTHISHTHTHLTVYHNTALLLHFSYPNYTYPNHITSHIFQSLLLYTYLNHFMLSCTYPNHKQWYTHTPYIPYSRKIWQFGGLYYNRQIKIRQNFLLAYIRMAIPYRTAKFKSANILLIAIWGSTAKFNARQYFRLYGIS